MSKNNIKYDVLTFPSSEKYNVFKVFGETIYQILTPESYNIDTGEVEYMNMIFDDPVTAEIIADCLNEAEKRGD